MVFVTVSATKKVDKPGKPCDEGVTSIKQGNVTLTFKDPTEVLENFQGNHFIKGPVTVAAIDPPPTGEDALRRHGAMVNP
ncbi:MAG: hypothetical protein EHM23_31455, partial [Acidobacteria bacterium]